MDPGTAISGTSIFLSSLVFVIFFISYKYVTYVSTERQQRAPLSGQAAVPATTARWQDPEYTNWLKVGLGRIEVKVTITPATKRIMAIVHKRIGGKPAVPSDCTCTFADMNQTKICIKTGCSTCDPLYKNIMRENTTNRIMKDNCEPCAWQSDAWEVAKAFMGPGQKSDNHGPEGTDCSNLMLLWENCIAFHSHIQDTNLLKNVRETMDRAMHNATMKVSDADMASAFQSMLDLLQDPTLAAETDIDASAGISRLEAIREQQLRAVTDTDIADLINKEIRVWGEGLKETVDNIRLDNKHITEFFNANPDLLDTFKQKWPERMSVVEKQVHALQERARAEQEQLKSANDSNESLKNQVQRGQDNLTKADGSKKILDSQVKELQGRQSKWSEEFAGSGQIGPVLHSFDDSNVAEEQSLFVKGMKIWIRGLDKLLVIGGLEVFYSNGTSKQHGSTDPTHEDVEFHLRDEERITGVDVRSGWLIDSLTFHTNLGKIYGPYGGTGGSQQSTTSTACCLACVAGSVVNKHNYEAIVNLRFKWVHMD